MSDVDWASLGAALPGAPEVAALVAGLETDVPVVLLPVRVETRFDQVEVSAVADAGAEVVDALSALHTAVRRLAERSYVTALSGTVKAKKTFKTTVEAPLYDAAEADLDRIEAQLAAVATAATAPVVAGGTSLANTLSKLCDTIGSDIAEGRRALGQLRSPYQRDRFVARLDAVGAQAQAVLTGIRRRTIGAVRLAADLNLRPAEHVARSLGLSPTGRPLRADLPTSPGRTPTAPGTETAPPTIADRPPAVLGDGTAPVAVGAQRAIALDNARLADTAAAVEAIRAGLAAGGDPARLLPAAAAIAVLPGAWKEELLKEAAAVPGADQVAAAIAAAPSGRADLDAAVPEHLRRVVYELPKPTRLEHRLQVRIYPEPLAVDTHEPELTDVEAAAAQDFWAETLAAGPDANRALGAWRALCAGRSTRRAAWIAQRTEPSDPQHTPGALAAAGLDAQLDVLTKRLRELAATPAARRGRMVAAVQKGVDELRAAVAAVPPLPAAAKDALVRRLSALAAQLEALSEEGLLAAEQWARELAAMRRAIADVDDERAPRMRLSDTDRRASTWTRAATSGVLPDRFAVVTIAGGRVTHIAQGAPVPADLKLSIDPSAPAGGFALDEDGNLQVDDAIRWMVDLDVAVARGMAVSVPLTAAEAQAGFDEVLVIGLAGGDAADGAERLAAMLDAHHYAADGLALLSIGTPTNNTEAAAAGHSTADDPDEAFPIERGPSLVAAAGSDGGRLAAALGVADAHLAHVRGADGTDANDSRTATAALYGATIGHAVEELATGLVSLDGRERLRAFVTGAVSARGLLPALRVADEPYGVLPISSLSRFVPDQRDARPRGADPAELRRQALFDSVLLGVLRQMHADWTRLRAAVKHAHSPDVGQPGYDAQQHFLGMLGLQATSVAASSYRFAVNVADRGGVRGRPDLSLSFGIPALGEQADPTAARFGPYALMERFAQPLAAAFGMSDTVLRAPAAAGGGVADGWRDVYRRLTESRAYQLRYLFGPKPLRGVIARDEPPGSSGSTAPTAALLDADYAALAELALRRGPQGTPLAQLLLRHALLAEGRRAALRILFREGLLDDAGYTLAASSSTYDWTTLSGSFPVSSWGVLLSSVAELDRRYGAGNSAGAFARYIGNSSMADYLSGRGSSPVFAGYAGRADHQFAIDGLTEHAAAVAALGALPAPRADALVREHLDLGGHRLDAWLTGLAQRRLDAMRAARPGGARIGAFGWVENLRPDSVQRDPAALPPALAGRPGRAVVTDAANQGFIQTPSPAHAVTAAILRGGFVSQANEGALGNEMSINLGSGRVRTALGLIDGVRAGNDLGALLGYRMERFLHEYYARPDTPQVTELDQLIAPLRRAFPTVAAVDPGADAGPERERQVVDGLAVVRTVLDWVGRQPALASATGTLHATLSAGGFAGYPWGLPAGAVPPAARVDQVDGLLRALDDLANAVDALADLTTAEAVHQIVRGNHPRAAAVLQAMAEGVAPPAAEIAQSPRSGLSVTHRLVLQLDPAAPGWAAIPPTPRAMAEPAVDAWLGGLLGDPASIRVRVRPREPDGGAVAEMSLVELGLRPLDLLAVLGPGYEAGLSELVARALDARRPNSIEPDQPGLPAPDPRDDYVIDPARAPQWAPGIRGIADVSALLESVSDLLGRARPARPAQYAAQGAGAAAGRTDEADASARIAALRGQAEGAALALARLLANDDTLDATVLDGDPRAFVLAHDDVHLRDDPDVGRVLVEPDLLWIAREAWRTAVLGAAAFGVRTAPPRRYASRAQVSKELLQAAEAGFVDLVARVQAARAADVSATEAGARLLDVAQALLGESALAVARIEVDPVREELIASLEEQLASPAELDGWLEGAATVREPARLLSEAMLLAELAGAPLGGFGMRVAQLPHIPGEPWLGGALADPDVLSGRVSVAIVGAALPGPGGPAVGLLLDEWTEVVPYREQTTGVAMHYDQPDATAPQSILIAVPPDRSRRWQLADLVSALHDTLEIARNRTVEPEHLGADIYGQVLPLAVGEVVPQAALSSSAPSGGRVILDFAQNNPGGR